MNVWIFSKSALTVLFLFVRRRALPIMNIRRTDLNLNLVFVNQVLHFTASANMRSALMEENPVMAVIGP